MCYSTPSFFDTSRIVVLIVPSSYLNRKARAAHGLGNSLAYRVAETIRLFRADLKPSHDSFLAKTGTTKCVEISAVDNDQGCATGRMDWI